ncbi:MAG: Asp-tRNA(Asn)/Glu-tRNA(Gln) amidotransferase subunit GatB [Bacteroidetes bacterium]|nr:Asp-tRNA(Asn)/Glu-tRNA(Gln) amidotransferase subunit GatB [Bacteroidota bacterium]
MMEYSPVIGLEIHAQLLTRSKLFCACATTGDDAPNSRTCPECLGHPGALPVLNAEAVRMAIRAGTALGCTLHPDSRFARKHYFYPDLPKGYQITQYDRPIGTGGALRFRMPDGNIAHAAIQRIHLEEDAGKLIHTETDARADDNRCGTPLLEIVTYPVFISPEAAVAFLQELRRMLMYIGICDGSMEHASLRCDANVSLRDTANAPGQRTEIKNLNSFRHIEHALHWEIDRQRTVLASGGTVEAVTLLWDENANAGSIMRGKESAADYHYVDDLDLPELVITTEEIESVVATLPELPLARAERLVQEHGLSHYDADVLTADRMMVDFFEELLRCLPADRRAALTKSAVHWINGELLAAMKNQACGTIPVDAARLAHLLERIDDGSISHSAAKLVFENMCGSSQDADALIAELGLLQVSDETTLRALAEDILEAHPAEVHAFQNGKQGLLGFFIQRMMEQSQGKADPRRSSAILRDLLAGAGDQEMKEATARRSEQEGSERSARAGEGDSP